LFQRGVPLPLANLNVEKRTQTYIIPKFDPRRLRAEGCLEVKGAVELDLNAELTPRRFRNKQGFFG
jgi:hypothetical protein